MIDGIGIILALTVIGLFGGRTSIWRSNLQIQTMEGGQERAMIYWRKNG
jgi:hypothetical protein